MVADDFGHDEGEPLLRELGIEIVPVRADEIASLGCNVLSLGRRRIISTGSAPRVDQAVRERGFEVLGFPYNQFGAQEPGNAEEIANFCKLTYDVTFPVLKKVDVNGAAASPLYDWMKREAPGLMGSKSVKWNFTKFLIDREGKVVRRYAPTDTPARIEQDIEKLL